MSNNFCYIHIPFCKSKCKYCKFSSFGNMNKDQIDNYIKYLIDEINNTNFNLSSDEDRIFLNSIYFWWWTPSIIEIQNLKLVIKTLKKKYEFKNNIEITLEINTFWITKQKILSWLELGINRFSIWIQTLNNKSLEEIWRENKKINLEFLDNLWEILNTSIYKNITVSLDFIIWLPYVNKWETKKDIEYIIKKYDFINHISVYMLEDQYYPWNWKKNSIIEDEYLWEYENIFNFLKNKKFYRYEISNFAKKWYECKHNLAYWNHSNIISYWLWAHWYINKLRYSNSNNFKDYYNKEKVNYYKNTKDDIFLEKVMFKLRTSWLTQNLFSKLNVNNIENFVSQWYLKKYNKKIILTNKGVLILDYILKEII